MRRQSQEPMIPEKIPGAEWIRPEESLEAMRKRWENMPEEEVLALRKRIEALARRLGSGGP